MSDDAMQKVAVLNAARELNWDIQDIGLYVKPFSGVSVDIDADDLEPNTGRITAPLCMIPDLMRFEETAAERDALRQQVESLREQMERLYEQMKTMVPMADVRNIIRYTADAAARQFVRTAMAPMTFDERRVSIIQVADEHGLHLLTELVPAVAEIIGTHATQQQTSAQVERSTP